MSFWKLITQSRTPAGFCVWQRCHACMHFQLSDQVGAASYRSEEKQFGVHQITAGFVGLLLLVGTLSSFITLSKPSLIWFEFHLNYLATCIVSTSVFLWKIITKLLCRPIIYRKMALDSVLRINFSLVTAIRFMTCDLRVELCTLLINIAALSCQRVITQKISIGSLDNHTCKWNAPDPYDILHRFR